MSVHVKLNNCAVNWGMYLSCGRHFPAELKDHMSHDVLLLCVSCHQLASLHSDQLKARLAEEYGAPLASGANARYRQDHHLTRVRNSARSVCVYACVFVFVCVLIMCGHACMCVCVCMHALETCELTRRMDL